MLFEYGVWDEKTRSRKPEERDYEHTLEVFDDFKIKQTIPTYFQTVAELERWQRKIILASFDN